MLTALQIDRRIRNYSEVLDVCEYLGEQMYGSGVNALMVMLRASPEYIKTLNSQGFKRWVSGRSKQTKGEIKERISERRKHEDAMPELSDDSYEVESQPVV